MEHNFKVGDRVRLKSGAVDQGYARRWGLDGDLTIKQIKTDGPEDRMACAHFVDRQVAAFLSRLEPAEPAPALIDPAKTYQTRDGRSVRIYATDAFGKYPVHGAISLPSGEWAMARWTTTGELWSGQKDNSDLIEVKPEREGWINVYPNNYAAMRSTKRDADCAAASDRIACLHVKFREGEGLS